MQEKGEGEGEREKKIHSFIILSRKKHIQLWYYYFALHRYIYLYTAHVSLIFFSLSLEVLSSRNIFTQFILNNIKTHTPQLLFKGIFRSANGRIHCKSKHTNRKYQFFLEAQELCARWREARKFVFSIGIFF